MSRRGWALWVVVGAVVVAVGAVMLWAGLDAADKIGSVVGALCGVLGLGVSVYGLVRVRLARREESGSSVEPVTGRLVTNSVIGSTVTAPVVQTGSVGRSAVAGDRNVAGDHNVVAGAGGVAVGQVVLPPVGVPAEPLPPPEVDLCVGRDRPVRQVVAGWAVGESVAVVGGPGIGKSTVLGRAIGDRAVVESYGARRFVVSCDGAESADAVVAKLAQVLGVALGEHLRNRVVSFVRSGPCVVVLDNFETVADGDPAGAAELVAQLRAGADRVALGLGYRGAGLPLGGSGAVEIRLGPLAREAAVEVFAAVAGDRHRADPNLDALLADLDGVPLAIVLLASLARAEPRLDTVLTAWQAKRTDLLQRAHRPDRTSSLPVSIELSWDRLSPDARAALSLAALLPDGWPPGRSAMYLPDELAAGVIEIGGRALLHDDGLRQRCLTPVRQHVLTRHAPEPALLGRLTARVRTLAERCREVGGPQGAGTVADVVPELINIVEVIRAGLPHEPDLAAAVPDLLRFQRFTGLGDDQLALDVLASAPTPTIRANTTFALAQLYTRRSDNDRARDLFNQALPLYHQIGAVLGQANCLRNLGQVEFRESHNDRARELFEQALRLYRHVRDRYSQAVAHAWLARTTTGDQRSEHCTHLNMLATDLNLDGFRESLVAISGC